MRFENITLFGPFLLKKLQNCNVTPSENKSMLNVCVVFDFAWPFPVVDKTCSSAQSSPFTVHKAFGMLCKILCILPYGMNIQKDHQQLLATSHEE